MTKLTLKIKNHSGIQKLTFSLFNVLYNSFNNKQLPKEIEITASVKNLNQKAYEVKYQDILIQIDIVPMMVNVIKSTNNRQLDFFRYDKKHLSLGGTGSIPMEPGLTINRKPRPEKQVKRSYTDGDGYTSKWNESEYVKKWNPKEWNIADTQELFILDNLVGVNINLLQSQEFELILNVHKRPDINKMLANSKFTFPTVTKK